MPVALARIVIRQCAIRFDYELPDDNYRFPTVFRTLSEGESSNERLLDVLDQPHDVVASIIHGELESRLTERYTWCAPPAWQISDEHIRIEPYVRYGSKRHDVEYGYCATLLTASDLRHPIRIEADKY